VAASAPPPHYLPRAPAGRTWRRFAARKKERKGDGKEEKWGWKKGRKCREKKVREEGKN